MACDRSFRPEAGACARWPDRCGCHHLQFICAPFPAQHALPDFPFRRILIGALAGIGLHQPEVQPGFFNPPHPDPAAHFESEISGRIRRCGTAPKFTRGVSRISPWQARHVQWAFEMQPDGSPAMRRSRFLLSHFSGRQDGASRPAPRPWLCARPCPWVPISQSRTTSVSSTLVLSTLVSSTLVSSTLVS